MARLRVRRLSGSRRSRDHLPRHRAQQTPRFSQPACLCPPACPLAEGRRNPRYRWSRMSPRKPKQSKADYELTLPALAITQPGGRTLYSFAVDGKKLSHFAAVSRVKRDKRHELAGYQRAESIAHIRTIRKYLESAEAMLPNALVVAFDSRVRFEADDSSNGVTVGRLVVPVTEGAAELAKPGWIVDGQQRTAAIREADIESFPVYVTAFIT